MCGIFGTTIKYTDVILVEKVNYLKNRGPDYYSIKCREGITLAHTRLSILDLNPRSHQPFDYKNISITFNGEIYNYLELKANLLKKGYCFTTDSDTEVICALYLDKGIDLVNYLNGMFAFVIHDKTNKLLFGARDRFGKKPFYYYWDEENFEFSSNLYSIASNNNLDVNREAVKYYLEWGFVPEPLSMFKKTYKLNAGYAFNLSLSEKSFTKWKYWDTPTPKPFRGTYEGAVEELNEIINESVRSRLIADVPLGIFLSGGIDSSLVAAVAQGQRKEKLRTFSIGFEEAGYDESAHASKIAEYLNTEHTSITLSCREGLDLIKQMQNFYDEPLDDSSSIAQLLLSKATKEYVTVALSGDGGDEFFLGYPQYQFAYAKRHLYNVPKFLRQLGSLFFKSFKNQKSYLYSRALQLNSVEELHTTYYSQLDRRWLTFERAALNFAEKEYLYTNKPLLERFSDYDIKTYMNGDILTKVDRGSMAFSLEVRSPLLDYKVLEFAKSLPVDYKFKYGNKKIILKDLLSKYLPRELYERPKQGFAVPIGEWFRNDLRDYLQDTLNKEAIASIPEISSAYFKEILNDHLGHKWNNTSKIYRVLMLVQWFNKIKIL